MRPNSKFQNLSNLFILRFLAINLVCWRFVGWSPLWAGSRWRWSIIFWLAFSRSSYKPWPGNKILNAVGLHDNINWPFWYNRRAAVWTTMEGNWLLVLWDEWRYPDACCSLDFPLIPEGSMCSLRQSQIHATVQGWSLKGQKIATPFKFITIDMKSVGGILNIQPIPKVDKLPLAPARIERLSKFCKRVPDLEKVGWRFLVTFAFILSLQKKA